MLSVLSLRQKQWSRVRVPVLTVSAFTAFTLAATLNHVHRLHLWEGSAPARSAAWLWLVIYLVVPFGCLAVVARQEHGLKRPRAVDLPMPGWLVALVAAQGAALFAAGAVLFFSNLTVPHEVTPVTHFWPWALTPLLELLVAVPVSSAGQCRRPGLWGYVALLFSVVPTGGYGWWAARRRAPSAALEDRNGPVRERRRAPADARRR